MGLLSILENTETSVRDNIDMNYVLNSYRSLMESLQPSDILFKYEASMVPIISTRQNNPKFFIALEDIQRVAKYNESSIVEALEEIIDINKCDDNEGEDICKDNTNVIILHDHNPDDIEEQCKKNPTTLKHKVKKVEEFTNQIDQLLDAGYKVVVNK